jgi:hypothetical protein
LKFLTFFSAPLVAVGIAKVGKEFGLARGRARKI